MQTPSPRAWTASSRTPTAREKDRGEEQPGTPTASGASPHRNGDIVFELKGACARYDGRPVLFDVDLTVRANDRIAVMGRSGAGKSTLLSLLYGQRPNDVALVPQASALVKPLSVFHNVYMGRLDRHSTAYNLRNLMWPAACELYMFPILLRRTPSGRRGSGMRRHCMSLMGIEAARWASRRT